MATGVLFLIFYGSVSSWLLLLLLLLLCAVAGICLKGRGHEGFAAIDYYAQNSPLNACSPELKCAGALLTIVICLAAGNIVACFFVLMSMAAITCGVGRIPVAVYMRFLLLPVGFIVLSALGIMLEAGATQAAGARLGFSWAGINVYITPQGQHKALLVTSKAVAAVSSLYLLNLTTPMHRIIGVLRRRRAPGVVIELMYLIYRYIFILMTCLEGMSHAAEARLGYATKRKGLRTASLIAAGLLRASFQRAGANYDAMLSRGYDGRLCFFERETKAGWREYAAWAGYLAVVLAVAFS